MDPGVTRRNRKSGSGRQREGGREGQLMRGGGGGAQGKKAAAMRARVQCMCEQ